MDLAEKYADRILGLHDGELVFDGPAADLTSESKGVIYRGEEPPESATAVGTSEPSGTEPTDHRPEQRPLSAED